MTSFFIFVLCDSYDDCLHFMQKQELNYYAPFTERLKSKAKILANLK